MKPTTHIIPLTRDERVDVVEALKRAGDDRPLIDRANRQAADDPQPVTEAMFQRARRAREVLPIVSLWPAEPNGMIDLMLHDDDRKAVRAVLERSYSLLSLRSAFDGYKLDEVELLTALEGAADPKPYVYRRAPGIWAMYSFLRRVANDCEYVDAADARPRYYVDVEVARGACVEWEKAGLCTLRHDPAAGRRTYDRIRIEWANWMWRPPYGRRAPAPKPLTEAENSALNDLACS